MIKDLLIGIVASLIASLIVGFFSNKAITNKDSLILEIYVLFISFSVFITGTLFSVGYYLITNFSASNTPLSSFVGLFKTGFDVYIFIFGFVSLVTLVTILFDFSNRSSQRESKEHLEHLKIAYDKDFPEKQK